MKSTSVPALISVPFADQGSKNVIPVESQIGITDGAASFIDGFPPLTMTPVAAGGIPPAGNDFNGVLNAITQSLRWSCTGGQYSYDAAFSTAIGGYPKGALIEGTGGDVVWLNTIDDNITDPATGAGWIPAIRSGLTTVGLADVNVALTPEQAAKKYIVLTGELTANVQLIMPTWIEAWLVINNTSGNFTVSIKTASGSGVNLSAGITSQVYGDGTNIYYGSLMVKNNFAEIKAAGANSQSAARNNLGLSDMSTANPDDFVKTAGDSVEYLDNATYYKIGSQKGWYGAGGYVDQYTNNSAPFIIPDGVAAPNTTSMYHPIVKGMIGTDGLGYGTAVSFGVLMSGYAEFAQASIHVIGEDGSGGAVTFSVDGTLSVPGIVAPGSFSNFDNRYALKDGISYVGIASNDSRFPYMRAAVTGELLYLARQDWVTSNFIQDIRRGEQGSMTTDGTLIEAPAGCFLTGTNGNEGSQTGITLYRPLQIYRNGVWATISG